MTKQTLWEWRCWRFWLVCLKHANPRSMLAIELEYSPLMLMVILQGNQTAWALTINLAR
jgi:hypothetical protein